MRKHQRIQLILRHQVGHFDLECIDFDPAILVCRVVESIIFARRISVKSLKHFQMRAIKIVYILPCCNRRRLQQRASPLQNYQINFKPS
jgi:hypothetical protein